MIQSCCWKIQQQLDAFCEQSHQSGKIMRMVKNGFVNKACPDTMPWCLVDIMRGKKREKVKTKISDAFKTFWFKFQTAMVFAIFQMRLWTHNSKDLTVDLSSFQVIFSIQSIAFEKNIIPPFCLYINIDRETVVHDKQTCLKSRHGFTT